MLLQEKQALRRRDRNLGRKCLSRESLRSNTHGWESSDGQD
jgi:hypothetical protein